MFELLQTVINDLDTAGKLHVNVSVPSLLINAELDVTAPGLKEAVNHVYKVFCLKINEQFEEN